MAARVVLAQDLDDALADAPGEELHAIVDAKELEPGLGPPGGHVHQPLVEQRRDRVERRLVDEVVALERDERLLDGALAQDEDQAGHPLVDRDEVDPPDVGVARLGRRGEAGRAGDRGEGGRGEAEPVLAGVLHLAELVPDHELLDGRQRNGLGDRLHVEAIAGVGRDAPGRGVRVGQQAVGLELGQDAPHGRAGDGEAVAFDERVAADRRRGRDVFLDDGPKDRLRAKVQGAEWAAIPSRQGLSPKGVSTLWWRVLTVLWAS